MTFGAKLSLQGRFCARTQTEFCPTSSSPLPSHLPPSTIHRPPSAFQLSPFTSGLLPLLLLPVPTLISHFLPLSHISCHQSPISHLSSSISLLPFPLSSPFSPLFPSFPLFPFSLLLSPVPSFFSFFSSFPCFTAQQDRSPISSLSFPTLDPPVHSLVRKVCQKHADLPHQDSNRTDWDGKPLRKVSNRKTDLPHLSLNIQ